MRKTTFTSKINNLEKQTKEPKLKSFIALSCYILLIFLVGFVEPAYADWFKVGDIKANLITPVYGLVNENLGYVAFAVGGLLTFLARGMDMWQKAMAFGAGAFGTAGAVKLAQTVLHLG